MNNNADSILCQIAAAHAACHWLPTGQPISESKLSDVLSFCWGLPDSGIPWQCRSRDDRTALEDLRRRGLVTVSGATSGIRVKLTTEGASCFWFLDKAALTVQWLADLPTVRTPWGADVILGCELCTSAGDWFSDTADDAYLNELADMMVTLKPLFCLGWARQFVSVNQCVWAVQITPAGVEAATNPPAIEPDAGFVFDAEAYSTAWAEAVRRYSTNPPPCDGSLPRYLPASRWTANQFDASL